MKDYSKKSIGRVSKHHLQYHHDSLGEELQKLMTHPNLLSC